MSAESAAPERLQQYPAPHAIGNFIRAKRLENGNYKAVHVKNQRADNINQLDKIRLYQPSS
jgi:hypothetical protein